MRTALNVLRILMFFGGLGAIWYGLFLWHPPVAWVVSGAVLMLMATVGALRGRSA